MVTITQKIREIAGDLLAKERVDYVIGFRTGTLPMMSEPFHARRVTDVQKFIWDSTCRMNLATYLINRTEKIGIMAKGCDSRNIVNHIVEGKIKRNQLHIVGIPCSGMLDKDRVAGLYRGEISSIDEDNDTVIIKGSNGVQTIKKAEILRSNCQTCQYPNPVIYDELAAELIAEPIQPDLYSDVQAIEALSPDEKSDFFDNLYTACVRCYACKNACPLCYCPTCFVDETNPQWLGKSDDLTDIKTFHLLRAFHSAGRCVDCGACENACPQHIPVRTLTRKMLKDSQKFYQWEAGLTIDQRPPLDTYQSDDPDAFIK